MRYLLIALLLPMWLGAQPSDQVFPAIGSPANPKVAISWNRYNTSAGLAELEVLIEKAHTGFVKRHSIGKSHLGNDIWCLTVTDFSVGKPEEKPAYYVDGNIHSNEIQASEVSLYLAWYLVEMRDNPRIAQLLKEKVFYIIPTINPDGRDNYMLKANTTHSPRSGVQPRDNDRDGMLDEDLMDDLNGDGHITQMRRRSPTGRFYPDPTNPRRMLQAPADQFGGWELLGNEGLDNDGDGNVNEDGTGYTDPNRTWPWGWQPATIEGGTDSYPLSLPETRTVADFILAHPNIAGVMSFHNTGGMILRGPGNKEDEPNYRGNDLRVYDAIGKWGESIMPGYRYINTYEDLYQVYGGETDWTWGGLGIFSYTGELYNSFLWFGKNENGYWTSDETQHKFDDQVVLNEAFVDWKPYKHPQYGEVEIGGFKKNYLRINPGFQLEEESHRNAAFMIYHAWHTPQLKVGRTTTKALGNGLTEVTIEVQNDRLTPTHAQHDLNNKITPPNVATLTGGKVLSSYLVYNPDQNLTSAPSPQPERLLVPNVPGMGTVTLRYMVQGTGPWQLEFRSAKGGVLRATVK